MTMLTLMLADAAATAPADWRAWLTPENVVAVMSLLAAVFGWLGRTKYKRVAEAVITGVESYRRSDDTPAAARADVATEIRRKAEESGVEPVLNGIVKLLTEKKP